LAAAPPKIRLHDRNERVGLLRTPAVRRAVRIRRKLGTKCDFPCSHRTLDRASDELAVFFPHLDRDPHAAAGTIAEHRQGTALPSAPRDVDRLRFDVAHLPAALFYMRCGRLERVREQQILVARVRDARQGANLRVRQPPVGERSRDRRQAPQRLSGADLLARR